MLLTKIYIKNYRLLVDAWMDVDSNMTLIVGRNNTAKTSCMDIVENVLKNNPLSFDDYPLNKRQGLFNLITSFMKKDISFDELNQKLEVTSVDFTIIFISIPVDDVFRNYLENMVGKENIVTYKDFIEKGNRNI